MGEVRIVMEHASYFGYMVTRNRSGQIVLKTPLGTQKITCIVALPRDQGLPHLLVSSLVRLRPTQHWHPFIICKGLDEL
jgi:hypothetical protein